MKKPPPPGEGPVGSRWLPALPPRSSVLLPGAGNEAKKAIQPKKDRAKKGQQYDVDDSGLGHGHVHAPAVVGDDDRDMATMLAVQQAHVRLRGGCETAVPSGSGECTSRSLIAQPVVGSRRYRPHRPIIPGRVSVARGAAPATLRAGPCASLRTCLPSLRASRAPSSTRSGTTTSSTRSRARPSVLGDRPPPRPRGHQPAGLHRPAPARPEGPPAGPDRRHGRPLDPDPRSLAADRST